MKIKIAVLTMVVLSSVVALRAAEGRVFEGLANRDALPDSKSLNQAGGFVP